MWPPALRTHSTTTAKEGQEAASFPWNSPDPLPDPHSSATPSPSFTGTNTMKSSCMPAAADKLWGGQTVP